MTGTITYILSRAGFRAMNGPLSDERRRLAGAEPPAAYVSYDPRLLAGAGWYGYRIALKGGDRQMFERARYMLSERYTIRDGYEYYADGVYVFGVLLRERVPHYCIGGGAEPTPEPDTLNFYMPNGGTISLNKSGSPAIVELEYWFNENKQWIIWEPDVDGNRSLTLTAGQTVYIRNTSETSTRLNTSTSSYYYFQINNITYAYGNVESLLCKNFRNAIITSYCFLYLFRVCIYLISAPILNAENISSYAYFGMFYACSRINYVKTYMKSILDTNSIVNWLYGVSSTGDFYCPAELTIPTGASGIPSGWTRHDI